MQVIAAGHGEGRLVAGWLVTDSKYLLATALTRWRSTRVMRIFFEALSHTTGPISGDVTLWVCQSSENFSI
jgi:hypothetical protein